MRKPVKRAHSGRYPPASSVFRLGLRDLSDHPETAGRAFERLISQRTHRMVERILPYLERGNAFVALGALHLPGDDGILSLLEKRGIRVRALY